MRAIALIAIRGPWFEGWARAGWWVLASWRQFLEGCMDEDTRPNIHLYFTASYEGFTKGRLTSQARFCFSYTRFFEDFCGAEEKKDRKTKLLLLYHTPTTPEFVLDLPFGPAQNRLQQQLFNRPFRLSSHRLSIFFLSLIYSNSSTKQQQLTRLLHRPFSCFPYFLLSFLMVV